MSSVLDVWTGRDDRAEEGPLALRWGQCVQPWSPDFAGGVVLLGFAADEGVRRNQGRVGAAGGPNGIRKSLANLAWHVPHTVADAGTIPGEQLEDAQAELASRVAALLQTRGRPVILGGGHETAWGVFQGLEMAVSERAVVGIVNLDAHFDLRQSSTAHSGTPFRQMAQWCRLNDKPFRYLCLGVAESANTKALFQTAESLGVLWRCDRDLEPGKIERAIVLLAEFLSSVDAAYLSLDLDVLPGWVMPAVSAPASFGVALESIERLVVAVAETGKLAVAEVVEYNPTYDRDGQGGRVAARLVSELCRAWRRSPLAPAAEET